ncbi:hypothetical protein ES707_00528 [subsurface metagenome]
MRKVETIKVTTMRTGDFSPVGPRPAPEPHSGALPGCATPRHTYTTTYLRAQQLPTPHQSPGSSPHQSPPRRGLKSPTPKSPPRRLLTKKSALPPRDFSPRRGSKVPHTFSRSGSSKMVVTSKTCFPEGLHHEDHKN